MDRDFGFQLGDTPASRGQLSVLAAGPAGQLPGVDQMLPAPDIDCLLADSQIGGDLSHRTASCDQIKNLAAELGGIPLRHRSGDPLGSEDRDHPARRLHPTRGTSLRSVRGWSHVGSVAFSRDESNSAGEGRWSHHERQLSECCCDANRYLDVGDEFVVAAAEILDEGVPSGYHGR